MLETSNLARKYRHLCSFRKYTFYTRDLLILLMVAFFLAKKSGFFCKNSAFTKTMCENCVRAFLVLFSVFVRKTFTINENYVLQTVRWESGFTIAPNWP